MKTLNKVTAKNTANGFTLVELLLVLTILGILAGLVVPRFAHKTEQAKLTAAKTQISMLGTALDNFEIDNGCYPSGKDGLKQLVVPSKDASEWRGPYVKGDIIPLDPWGNPYVYTTPGKYNPDGYDLESAGEDGRIGTDDDICNWTMTVAAK